VASDRLVTVILPYSLPTLTRALRSIYRDCHLGTTEPPRRIQISYDLTMFHGRPTIYRCGKEGSAQTADRPHATPRLGSAIQTRRRCSTTLPDELAKRTWVPAEWRTKRPILAPLPNHLPGIHVEASLAELSALVRRKHQKLTSPPDGSPHPAFSAFTALWLGYTDSRFHSGEGQSSG
jgi:hypothetical protein